MVTAGPADRTGRVNPMVPIAHRVLARAQETADSVTLTITPVSQALRVPGPGQFNMLYAFGLGEAPISVSATPGDGTLVHTIRAVGSVSAALCRLEPGAVLGVRGPFGTTWPLERAQGGDVVVMAGGVGLAPLRPLIHQLIRRRDEFRRVIVLVGARRPEELLFGEELRGWSAEPGLDLRVTVDSAGPGWSGDVGVVTTLLGRVRFEPARTFGFACGPEIMMRFGLKGLHEAGVPSAQTFLSMERNMKCAIGLCGHCQWTTDFICKDGPVFDWPRVGDRMTVREL